MYYILLVFLKEDTLGLVDFFYRIFFVSKASVLNLKSFCFLKIKFAVLTSWEYKVEVH